MKVYRISKKKYANELSGFGAGIFGGRWNTKGKNLLYTASSISLAALEILVHTDSTHLDDLAVVEIEVPDDLLITTVNESLLPKKWHNYNITEFTKSIGDNWLENNIAIALKVPSVIVRSEYNLLINPSNNGIKRIKINSVTPWIFDERLFDEKNKKKALQIDPVYIETVDPIIQEQINQLCKIEYDIFISNSEDDVDEVVMPIVKEIMDKGYRYWFSKEKILLGDSILEKTNSGVQNSRYVLAIISKSYINDRSNMTQLHSVISKQMSSNTTRFLPVIVAKTAEEKKYIKDKLELFRDFHQEDWKNNAKHIVNEITKRIRSDNLEI